MRIAGRRTAGAAGWLIVLTAGLAPATVAAQEGDVAGFGAEESRVQESYEAILLEAIEPDSIKRWARALGARPHVAGTPEQALTRDSVLAWMARAGLDTRSDTLVAYLPHPRLISLQRLQPDPRLISLDEPELAEAGAPARDPFRAFNAYTGSGRVEAEVVFANYGLAGDYLVLDSLGIDVAGAIVVARYGRSFRGIKVREAERRGAAGLVLYSDPADDGYRAGDVYPGGPMRPGFGVQRGSVLNSSGDPSTPGWPSLPGARRVPEEEMRGVARIPVVPVSYEAATELLSGLKGPSAPREWQGALPFHYRTGPGPVRAGLTTETERGGEALHPIYNTIGVLPGSELPDEWVVLGAHRDAWGPGAVDNVSGTATVLAAAHAFAAAARQGWRPRRTILFATWDAEEWGLVGSTEWVEAHADQVGDAAVAYINQDAPVGGPDFYASATPELKLLVRDAAAEVESPDGGGTVLEEWARSNGEASQEGPPRVRDLGGGSDHVPFVQMLGIPGAGFGFGGRGGVYHSAYDAADWMERFGDPGYRRHAAAASVLVVLAARLANAELLPYDFPGLAADVEKRVAEIMGEVRRFAEVQGIPALAEAVESVRRKVFRLGEAAGRFDSAAAAAVEKEIDDRALEEANRHLRSAARAFVSEREIRRPGLRQILYATDPDDGYATLPLPGIRLAMRREDATEAGRRIEELGERVVDATDHLAAARRALDGLSAPDP